MHPEIVFVAPIGGINCTVFVETHTLDVVKSSAPGRTASNGMAPIEDPSPRDCGQRHGFLQFSLPPFRLERHYRVLSYCDPCAGPAHSLGGKTKAGAGNAVGTPPVSSGRPAARTCR